MKELQQLIKRFYVDADSLANGDAYIIKAGQGPEMFSVANLDVIAKEYIPEDAVDTSIIKRIKEMPRWLLLCPFKLRSDTIYHIFSDNKYASFITDERKTVIVHRNDESSNQIEYIIQRINSIFEKYFNTTLYIEKMPPSYIEVIKQRIREIELYYLETHGPWTQNFIDTLGDDISRISFRAFLKQRLHARIFRDRKVMYPFTPPVQTESWRVARRSAPPSLPHLGGCSEGLRNAFYLHTFIYEQYAIPGVVEAMPGQCVIDAGAFIGDTAIYFSQKVGATGKVYAFEPVPDSVAYAEENMRQNGCSNVEMICAALADTKKAVRLIVNPVGASSSYCSHTQDDGGTPANAGGLINSDETPAVALDDFVAARGIIPGFIKADVEGYEMHLLRGAEQTIRDHAPTCGLALYHRWQDYHEIPQFLSALCPEYVFYFRCEAEPVLFAVKP
jgi:FkbM family methyltransferase